MENMDNVIKKKLSIYGLISAISYGYLILQPRPGISVPLFIILQFISIYYVLNNRSEVKNKRAILMMIPIFIISLNYFMIGNTMFHATNYIVILLLYHVMILFLSNDLSLRDINFSFIFDVLCNMFVPLFKLIIPFKWYSFLFKDKINNGYKIKSILIGIIISFPIVIFLLIMLSSADIIFSNQIGNIAEWLFKLLDFLLVYRFVIGGFVGLYLLCLLYLVFETKKNSDSPSIVDELKHISAKHKVKGNTIIFNILLISILFIYTFFIIIQFKYLFAGAELPNGLNYSEYARRGFFELVFLSVLNISLILLTIHLLREQIYMNKLKWSQLTKIFLFYLCLVTMILLISSFYRMMLYDNAYGFTRLRILVYSFLIFEAIGLLITFKYILKPDMNIIAIYTIIGLSYYLLLNIMPIDNIIAKNNVDMYLNGEAESIDIDYLMSLSADVTPQIMRLTETKEAYKAYIYLEGIYIAYYQYQDEEKWQSYNLSIERAKKVIHDNMGKLQFHIN